MTLSLRAYKLMLDSRLHSELMSQAEYNLVWREIVERYSAVTT